MIRSDQSGFPFSNVQSPIRVPKFKCSNSEMLLLQLRGKANELWETIVRLETEKYDLEERQKRQDYDVSSVCGNVSADNF